MRELSLPSSKTFGASLALAAVLAVPTAMTLTGVAGAQTTGGDLPAASYLPDSDLTSTLAVHKLGGAESGVQDTGVLGQDSVPADATPLEGITFQVERVDVDLTERAGWDTARTLTPDTAPIDGSFAAQTGVTGADGQTVFSDLPLGMYLVTETDVPYGVIAGQPFLVYLPMTVDTDGDGEVDDWNQDVHVYPKNSVLNADKTVVDAGAQVADTVTYTITGTVPTSLTEENSTIDDAVFEFHDFLDAENAYVGPNQAIALEIVGGAADGTVMTEGTHYTVTGNDAGPDTPGSQTGPRGTQHIQVVLTNAGLEAIIGADNVVMTMDAVVKPVADTDGVTFNFVRQLTNDGRGGGSIVTSNIPGDEPEDPTEDPPVDDPTPGVETYHGTVTVTKVDGDNTNLALEGAAFQLYASTTAGLDDVTSVTDQGELVTVAGQDTWVTNEDGTFTIDGLHASDFADNAVVDAPVYYYLVETEAPDGYALLDVVVPFELNAADAEHGVTGGAIEFVAQVENVTDENFLPMTGGAGILGLLGVGAALAGGGYALSRRGGKDDESDDEATAGA